MAEKSRKNVAVVILAAGMGTRMKSLKPKVMHEVACVPMIEIVLGTARKITDEICVVVSDENKGDILKLLQNGEQVAVQGERLGTAHAAMVAKDFMLKSKAQDILVLYADTPLIMHCTLEDMLRKGDDVTCLGFRVDNVHNKYGRLVTRGQDLLEIIEYKDATELQRGITLCNSGVFCINKTTALQFFDDVRPSKITGEYYLTDIVKFANSHGKTCGFLECDGSEVLGVNSCEDLAIVDSIMQKRLKEMHMQNGVRFLLPETTYIALNSKFGKDVVIQNGCFIGKGVVLCDGVEVRSNSYIEDCEIESSVTIGPFARVRGKTAIGRNSRIGNFVEVKNVKMGENSKVNHLAYIGDCAIGSNVNIGAGAVFCNYNGFRKFTSVVQDGVFIGSNATIVSPVEVGSGSIIAAGSVVTKDTEKDALIITRAEEKSIKDGAARFRKKNAGK